MKLSMPKRIHYGKTTLWLAGHWDASIGQLLSRPSVRVYTNPSPADLDAALQELWSDNLADIVLMDNDTDRLLHGVSARYTCIDAAGGLVADASGRYLMIYRRGYWDLPKGKLDEGESLEECALREVREETGLFSIRSEGSLLTTYHLYRQDGMECFKSSHWYRMSYYGTEPAIPQTEEDIERIEWLTREQVQDKLPHAYPSIRQVMETVGIS